MQLSVATCLVLASGIGVSCAPPAAPTDYAHIELKTLEGAPKAVKEQIFTDIWNEGTRRATDPNTGAVDQDQARENIPDIFLDDLYLHSTDSSATNFKNRKTQIRNFWKAIAAQLKAEERNRGIASSAMATHLDVSRNELLQYLKDDVQLAQGVFREFFAITDLEATRVRDLLTGDNTLLEVVGGPVFFAAIRRANHMASVPASVLKYINSNSDRIQTYCPHINAADLGIFTKQQLKEFESACLAKVAGDLSGISGNFTKYVREMKADIFALYGKDLHEDVLAKITADQLNKFGSRLSDPLKRCAKLSLSRVNKEALKRAPGACVATYILAKGASDLGKAWETFPSDLFAELNDELKGHLAEIARAISETDKSHMSAALLNQLHKSGKFAKNLVEGGERSTRGAAFELDGKTLAKINDFNIVIRALQSSNKLSDDLLAYVTADLVSEKFRATVKGKNYEGLQLLDLIQKASNKETIIKNLGSKVSPKDHPCTTIRSFSDFETLQKSASMLSEDCFEAMPFSATLEQMKSQTSLIRRYDATMFDADDYKTMKAAFAKALVRTNFCSAVSEENFKLLSQEALSAIDARCLVALPFASKLTDETLTRFGNDAFALITTDLWKKNDFTFKSMNDKQLGQLSVSVAPEASVFRNLVTPETLKELGGRVKQFTAKQVAALPDATLIALNMADVAPAALGTLSAAQAEALLKVSASSFTDEHVYQIGTEGSDKAAVLKVLCEHAKSFGRPAVAALEKRIAEAAKDEAKTEDSSMGTYLLYGGIGLLVVVIAGAAVMFFLRKN